MRVCIDADGQVVFFTPKGKTLLGAPPVRPPRADARPEELWGDPGGPQTLGGDSPGERRSGEIPWDHRPRDRTGAPRLKRDSDIPWAIEASAWEALDSG